MIQRTPFLCIDAQWLCRWKWLWSPFAAENEGYTGYVDAWDSIPFKQVKFDDGMLRDNNYAAAAQYRPSYGGSGDYYHIYDLCVGAGLPPAYCHNCLGLVQDLGLMLERDGVAGQEILAQYSPDLLAHNVPVRNLFYRNFDPANIACTIVFSRPMTYKHKGGGHIADNAEQFFFARAAESCDGTIGLRATLVPQFRREFCADAIWFSRSISDLPTFPSDARLVVYIIAAGSVPRIRINGIWHIVSPVYFPSYGDPYGYIFRGYKATIAPHGLLSAGLTNEIVVEHIAPLGDSIGAQVIFVMESKIK